MRKVFTLKVIGGIFVLAGLFPVPLAVAAPAPQSAVTAQGRVRVNFNADWRFTLGDVHGGQDPGFDDAKWEPLGLPHSLGNF